MEYILKHKDIAVLSFSLDEEYRLKGKVKVHNKDHVPFGSKYAHDNTQIIESLRYWIDNRGLPNTRPDRIDLYKYYKVESSKELMLGSYGLNLSDHYWVHQKGTDLKWKDYNFFDNNFKDVFDEIKNGKKTHDLNPNRSVDGSLSKMWYIDEHNTRWLRKKGRDLQEQEPFNEVIASEIMKLLNIEHVEYCLQKIDNTIPVSDCRCMVDSETEIISASMVLGMEQRRGRNNYDLFIDNCLQFGIDNARECLDKMIFIDYIIGNEDRHLYNFGIIRNAQTLKWIKVTPLFDNGNSLYFDRQIINDIDDLLDTHCRWFSEKNGDKLKLINKDVSWYNTDLRLHVEHIINNTLLSNNKVLPEKRAKLTEIVLKRLALFEGCL